MRANRERLETLVDSGCQTIIESAYLYERRFISQDVPEVRQLRHADNRRDAERAAGRSAMTSFVDVPGIVEQSLYPSRLVSEENSL